jgi:pimeloyl-ACP methyl ester carboxylesterase/DNA-binding CsgD family transcriptional regulator
VVRYDRIGVGLSDRRRALSDMSLDAEVTLLEALIEHLGAKMCSLVGMSCGGCISAEYAARHPRRVSRVVIYAGYARGAALAPPEVRSALLEIVRTSWGFGSRVMTEAFMGGAATGERREFVAVQRAAASPDLAADLLALTFSLDARDSFTRVCAPTTVVHRTGDHTIAFTEGRKVATLVPGARFVPLPGEAHLPWHGDVSGTAATIAGALGAPLPTGDLPTASLLTRREREVLALVAHGFTDVAIAEHLVVSPHTVHRHVANIRTKLDLPSRAAAAAYAARLGLE